MRSIVSQVVGGSSSLNAMVYIRGHALDYDRWVTEGAQGWSYSEVVHSCLEERHHPLTPHYMLHFKVLPYFRKAQSHELGADDYRGGDGPLRVTTRHQPCELFDIFVEAGKQAGYNISAHPTQPRISPVTCLGAGMRRRVTLTASAMKDLE